jgi:hypothetical protein
MKSDEKVIAKAIRVDINESTGQVYLVFEVTDPSYKQSILREWINDIEFKIKDKNLVKE